MAAISLDLGRLDALAVDRVSLTATFGAGLRCPRAEARLQARGLTLGHFPQSFELATVGGCVATRSAGQASTGYGRIDSLVRGVRLRAPAGELSSKTLPASAAGPSLRELVAGSEGTLGVIVDATLAMPALPAHARTRRGLPRDHRLRGHTGHGPVAPPARGLAAARGRGRPLGAPPGSAWLTGRYAGPYLRDELLGRGLLVETLETAATWGRLDALYRAVADAIRGALGARGTPGLVGCHVSHLYPTGASLYYTFIARSDRDAPLDQWRAVKRAAGDAIVAHGGTITHHHAIGRDHAPWMPAEVGELGLELLAAAKQRLDPAGVMNPGKLLPPSA